MSQNCTFCQVVAGEIPSAKIYEDDDVLAFLDISPVAKGHVLVIPKEHHKTMTATPDELLATVFIKAKELMKVIKKAFHADFVVASVVGLDVDHFHVHLVPRFKDDGLANWWPTQEYEEGEMQKYVDKIKSVS